MSVAALGERARLTRFVVAACAGAAWRRVAAATAAPFHAGRTPDKLVIAPQDLRTSDPTRAEEIYAGLFAFAGKTVDTRGGSPFLAAPPSAEWAEALHGFGWLRHLRAADTTLARANARALVDEWISLRGGGMRVDAAAPQVMARRVMSWLRHSPLILDGADRAFYRRFLKSLTRQTRALSRVRTRTPDGLSRLSVVSALATAGLCLDGETRLLNAATKHLADELDRQILADGGHVSRNPSALVDVLLDLLPLRQAFSVRNVAPPQALLNAVDRAMPMLRFFRHGDGALAQFNGAGPTQGDLIATLLAYDDARGGVLEDALHSSYQRVTAGEALLLVDVGAAPPKTLSRQAHAGCLSFEFSSGPEQIIVNCGAPRIGRAAWDAAARATAAHSTAVIADTSSCRFVTSATLKRLVGPLIVAGPSTPSVKRERTDDGASVVAAHDGYRSRFGLDHERSLTLGADGDRLDGKDVFRAGPGARTSGPDPKVALRFHLHPSLRASATQDGHGVVLALPGGTGWLFAAPGFSVELEESVYLPGQRGPRRAEQIVVHATARAAPAIAWSLRRLEPEPGAALRRRSLPSSEEGPTLL